MKDTTVLSQNFVKRTYFQGVPASSSERFCLVGLEDTLTHCGRRATVHQVLLWNWCNYTWIFPSFSSDRNRSYVISERSTISTTNPNTLWSPSVEEKPDILCSTSSNRSFVGSFSRNKTERNVTLLDVPLIVLRILLVRVRRAHTTLVDLELGIAAVVDKASLTNAPGLWLCAGSWDTWFTVISLLTIPDPSSGLVLDDL